VDKSHRYRAIEAWAVPGISEIVAGDIIEEIIWEAVDSLSAQEPERDLREGDIVVVTSKIVSKSENRFIPVSLAAEHLKHETVRIVARRARDDGETLIVENSLGIVCAAAGIDKSNTPDGSALLLPEHPDGSARAIAAALRQRSGQKLGVVITDTLGRAWRLGQTDCAIGAAGIRVLNDLRGTIDAGGKPLASTITAVADEIAALADLVKGKSGNTPVAVIRGLAEYVTDDLDEEGAASIIRPSHEDMFRIGSEEAYAQGFSAGVAAQRGLKPGESS